MEIEILQSTQIIPRQEPITGWKYLNEEVDKQGIGQIRIDILT